MSKEIRELEENSKRIIENMRPQTIAQYHLKQWLDDNFIMGCARLHSMQDQLIFYLMNIG